MKLATWNINGVKARIDVLCTWLKEASPDLVALQEIKSVDEGFPRGPIEDLGYNIAVHGQKGFNGVAVLSKLPFDEVVPGLPGDSDDQQARYLEVVVSVASGVVRFASLYLPNGNPIDSDKFPYKLAWMRRLEAHARSRLALEEPVVLAGDYNVIPQPQDARRPELWTEDALFQPESRAAFRAILNTGYVDAVRATTSAEETYTFWDYQAGAWPKNNGIRIDHMLLSPQAADRLQAAGIDKHTRGWEKPSDHVPVWVTLDMGAG
ncbi:MAG: exodeoxyribonuclease III [Hyphomicrobiaceae bacterium]